MGNEECRKFGDVRIRNCHRCINGEAVVVVLWPIHSPTGIAKPVADQRRVNTTSQVIFRLYIYLVASLSTLACCYRCVNEQFTSSNENSHFSLHVPKSSTSAAIIEPKNLIGML